MNLIKRFLSEIFQLVIMGIIMFAANTAASATFCVSNSFELQAAFNTAASNGQDDTIQVVQGIYLTLGSQFEYLSFENFEINLLGGYTAGCSSRTLNPTNTILDGQNANRVIHINQWVGSGNILFQGFTVRNGRVSDWYGGAGLKLGGVAGSSGNYTVDHNIFMNNTATYFGGGINGGSDTGVTRIENNLIVNNSSTEERHGGASLTSNGTAYITNNTVSGNTATLGDGGLRLGASGTGYISNNIFFGNTGSDLILSTNNIMVVNNDIGSQSGTSGPGSSGNVNVNPQFVGPGNYRLQEGSPVINAGTNTPAGGLSVTDLDGNPRISGDKVDMGAYEFQQQPAAIPAIPTMTEWGMIIFIALAGLGSVYYLRRQRRA